MLGMLQEFSSPQCARIWVLLRGRRQECWYCHYKFPSGRSHTAVPFLFLTWAFPVFNEIYTYIKVKDFSGKPVKQE